MQRDENSEKALEIAVNEFSDVIVGAGTVLNIEQCKCLIDKGAAFIVSPGFDEKIVNFCLKKKIPVIPGTVTPTEVQKAVSYGLIILKFFPFFQMGGINMIKSLSEPFSSVRFIVTGGLEYKHLKEIMFNDRVYAAGGIWMFCEAENMQKKEYEDIVKTLKDSVDIVKKYESNLNF